MDADADTDDDDGRVKVPFFLVFLVSLFHVK
jgi:hypothetical protein